MSQKHNPDQLAVFDNNIRARIEGIRQSERCLWCKNPNHPLKAKGLCSHCYRWDNAQRKLFQEVSRLPAKTARDPYAEVRRQLKIANEAIDLCKIEGEVLEDILDRTDSRSLERAFDALSKRILGGERGSQLFYGKTFYFYDFSEMQRIWLRHLIGMLLEEMNRKSRHKRAFSSWLHKRNAAADAGAPAK